VVCATLFWAVALHAQVQLISRPVPPADAVERGQKLFVANCGFCHGANARGGEGGPDLVRSVVVLDDDNAEHIGPVVRQGRPGPAMPSFDLPRRKSTILQRSSAPARNPRSTGGRMNSRI
jgi:mono/diheme cytochrome c family protein